MIPRTSAQISGLARQSSLRPLHRGFSSSGPPIITLQAYPDWLQRILDDNAVAPKLFAWTLANLPNASAEKSNIPSDETSLGTGKANKRIHVLGVGNLGRLFASNLAKLQPKPPVTLVLHRKSLLEHWGSAPGIEITRNGQVEQFLDFDVEWWTEEKPSTGPVVEATAGAGIANLIVATKASDALPQVDRLRRYLSRSSTVAFTQNGMCKLWPPVGALYNHHRFPKDENPNWVACVTTHGVTSAGSFKSTHASVAAMSVGPVSLNAQFGGDSAYLVQQLVAGPDLSCSRATKSELWILQLEKLIVNSVINPLTAILRCKNGALFEPRNDNLPMVIDMLIREASNVLKTLVLHPSSIEILGDAGTAQRGTGVQFNLQAQEELLGRLSFQKLHKMVHEVGYKVRENTSSMLQDVRAGKRTEIRDFNGWLVDTARLLDDSLELPTHKRLISMVESGLIISGSELGDYFEISA